MSPISSLNPNEFANVIGINKYAPSERYSRTLLRQMQDRLTGDMPELNPSAVMAAIHELEGGPACGTKQASEFKREPLEGLWHKHYVEPGLDSALKNISITFKRSGLTGMQPPADATDPLAMSESIASHLIDTGITQRKDNKKYTGEWLVYAKHNNENYYLCIGKHGEDHQIRSLIENECLVEFPFLSHIMRPWISPKPQP